MTGKIGSVYQLVVVVRRRTRILNECDMVTTPIGIRFLFWCCQESRNVGISGSCGGKLPEYFQAPQLHILYNIRFLPQQCQNDTLHLE